MSVGGLGVIVWVAGAWWWLDVLDDLDVPVGHAWGLAVTWPIWLAPVLGWIAYKGALWKP